MTREEYLQNPCAASSLPYWKTRAFPVPEGVCVFHDAHPGPSAPEGWRDEPYFRLLHNLREIPACPLPEGLVPGGMTLREAARHVCACRPVPPAAWEPATPGEPGASSEPSAASEPGGVSAPEAAGESVPIMETELLAAQADILRSLCGGVIEPDLWLSVRDAGSGGIVASGVATVDPELGEGSLEWIQVSPERRRRGLGRYVVCELLRRMRGRAAFATVSGRVLAPDRPERLYRACGFTGEDIWHVRTRL